MAGEPSQSPEVKHYLSCFPAPPLVLKFDSPTTIGRAEDNTIVLADATVSRLHAVVEWKDGDFILRDPGSRNGVLVNGERVKEASLKSDDQIRIGESVFTFVSGEERAVTQQFMQRRRKKQSGGTEFLGASAVARSAGSLAGNMKDFALVELLQALDLGRKTGCITVVCEDLHGEMLLREGKVVGCSFGGLEGEDAAYAMLSLGDGTFDFEARSVEVEDALQTSTAGLLMEALRRIDEERRAQTEVTSNVGADVLVLAAEEPHDPSLDTKHGEEPPPEVETAAAEQGETMVMRRPPPDAKRKREPMRTVSLKDLMAAKEAAAAGGEPEPDANSAPDENDSDDSNAPDALGGAGA